MPVNLTSVLAGLLVLSVLTNAGLGMFGYIQKIEIDLLREVGSSRKDERNYLMELIPQLRPGITKYVLRSLIKRSYPEEQVNVIGDQVQWRFF